MLEKLAIYAHSMSNESRKYNWRVNLLSGYLVCLIDLTWNDPEIGYLPGNCSKLVGPFQNNYHLF